MQLDKMSATFDNDIILLGKNSEENSERQLVNFFKSENSVHSQINFKLDKRAINESNIIAKLEENIENQNRYYEKVRELKLLDVEAIRQYKIKERDLKIREMQSREENSRKLFHIFQESVANGNYNGAKQIAESIKLYNLSHAVLPVERVPEEIEIDLRDASQTNNSPPEQEVIKPKASTFQEIRHVVCNKMLKSSNKIDLLFKQKEKIKSCTINCEHRNQKHIHIIIRSSLKYHLSLYYKSVQIFKTEKLKSQSDIDSIVKRFDLVKV